MARSPNAELGLLGLRSCSLLAEAGQEASNGLEACSAHRHVRGDHIPHDRWILRQSTVGAADHPVEFLGEPRRSAAVPRRIDTTPNSHHVGIVECHQESLQPGSTRTGIIIDEGDDVARTYGDTGVSCAACASVIYVSDRDHTRHLEPDAFQERRVAVHCDHDLIRRHGLAEDGLDRCHEVVVPPMVVRTDDYRHARLAVIPGQTRLRGRADRKGVSYVIALPLAVRRRLNYDLSHMCI